MHQSARIRAAFDPEYWLVKIAARGCGGSAILLDISISRPRTRRELIQLGLIQLANKNFITYTVKALVKTNKYRFAQRLF
jgi:hypothetical protein